MKIRLALLGICIITFLSRTLGQWSKVFVDGHVIFRGQDSWYHIRLAQVLTHNFPSYMHNDYFVNPGGQPPVGWPPFLTYLIGVPGLALSERATEIWGALLPPIIAVLAVVVVYFLAKHVLGSKPYALVAALLVGILPSQFFQKTLLGFTDHHMLEVLFVSLSLLLLLKGRYILLGLTLGALFWTWTGAGYIIAILTLGVLAEMFRRRLVGENTEKLGTHFPLSIGIAMIMFVPMFQQSVAGIENSICLLVGGVTPLLLLWLSVLIPNKKLFAYLVPLIGMVISLTAFFLLPVTHWWGAVFNRGSAAVISEFTPMTVSSAFSNFGLTLLLFVPGIILFGKDKGNWILPVFALPILVSSLNQIRFSYYLIIPVAIFSAYFIKWVADRINPKIVIATTITIFVLATSLTNIIHTATFENTMSPGMYKALEWIRYNTPESKGDWYSLSSEQPDYQVLGWWDYSTWTAYIARRAPIVSPTGSSIPEMSVFFVDGNIKRVEVPAEKWYGNNLDIRYVIVNKDMDDLVTWVKYVSGKEDVSIQRLWVLNLIGWQPIYENEEAVVLAKETK